MTEEQKQAFYNAIIERVNNSQRFAGRNGIKITEIKEGYAKGEMPNIPDTQNTLGGIHGGAIATLLDTVSGAATASLGGLRVTVHCAIEFLRAAAPGSVICEAKVRKVGKAIVVCEGTITDSKGYEVAIGTFSFYNKV